MRTLYREKFPYKRCDSLLTPAEQNFYRVLKKAVPEDFEIHAKVRLADILCVKEEDWAIYGRKIASKHLDFVVIDKKTSAIRLAIELDDKTHDQSDRKARDLFLNKAMEAAAMPLFRVQVQKSYDFSVLAKILAKDL